MMSLRPLRLSGATKRENPRILYRDICSQTASLVPVSFYPRPSSDSITMLLMAYCPFITLSPKLSAFPIRSFQHGTEA